MTEERNHAILFAATLLSARKIIDALDSSKPNPGKESFIEKAIKEAAAIQLLPGFGRTRALGAWSRNILSTRELDLNRPHKVKLIWALTSSVLHG